MSEIDNEHLELLHAEIDGLNTSEDSASLARYLARDSGAREYFEELKALEQGLRRLERMPIPADLKPAVMAGLPKGVSDPREQFVARPGTRAQALRYVYAVAAGLVLGLVLTSWFWSLRVQEVSPAFLTGSMLPADEALEFRRAGGLEIAAAEVRGKAEAFQSESRLLLVLSLDAPEEIEVQIGFDPAEARLQGLGLKEGSPIGLSFEKELLGFRHKGVGRYTLAFDKLGAEVGFALRVVRSDKVIFSDSIAIGEGRSR